MVKEKERRTATKSKRQRKTYKSTALNTDFYVSAFRSRMGPWLPMFIKTLFPPAQPCPTHKSTLCCSRSQLQQLIERRQVLTRILNKTTRRTTLSHSLNFRIYTFPQQSLNQIQFDIFAEKFHPRLNWCKLYLHVDNMLRLPETIQLSMTLSIRLIYISCGCSAKISYGTKFLFQFIIAGRNKVDFIHIVGNMDKVQFW